MEVWQHKHLTKQIKKHVAYVELRSQNVYLTDAKLGYIIQCSVYFFCVHINKLALTTTFNMCFVHQ